MALKITSFSKIIDLSHSFSSDTIYWPTEEGFRLDKEFDEITENGYYYSANKFFSPEHGGTHIDAPIHFSKDSLTVDQIPLERLIAKAIVIDVSENSSNNPDYQVSISDFEKWESSFGKIPDNSIILLNTGYGKFWPDRVKYMGTDQRGKAGLVRRDRKPDSRDRNWACR